MTNERQRLLKMYQEKKISDKDYQLLSAALNDKSNRLKSMALWLVNPFQRTAGLYSLIIGLVIIAASSYFGSIAKIYFLSSLSVLNSSVVEKAQYPLNFSLLFCQMLFAWIFLSSLLLLQLNYFNKNTLESLISLVL